MMVRRVAVVLALVWVSACATPPAPALSLDGAADQWPGVAEGAGLDPLDADAIWGAGDHVCYRIESNADGSLRTWTLGLTLPEVPPPGGEWTRDPDPLCGFVRARLGRTAYYSKTHGPTPWLVEYQHSQPVAVRLDLTRGDSPEVHSTTVPFDAVAHVVLAEVDVFRSYGLRDLVGLLLGVEPLFDELLSVIRRPSAWSVLARGMSVNITIEFDDAAATQPEAVQTPLGEVTAFWLPATLSANDQEALRCRFLITWRHSPLLLSMGVLRIEAHHPDDEARRVSAHLVAARRGNEVRPDPDDFGEGIRRGMTMAEVWAARGIGAQPIAEWRSEGGGARALAVVPLPNDGRVHGRVAVFEHGRLCFFGFEEAVDEFLVVRGFEEPDR